MPNLNTFPDPSVAGDPIPGDAVPVSLIRHPFAKQIANVATGGKFLLTDGDMNPLDLFHSFHPCSMAGVAVVILNSLPTPLTLMDSYAGNLNNYNNGPQVSYPAVIDPATQDVKKAHQIPGVRIYPRPSLHTDANNTPLEVGGVGLYRFQASAVQGVGLAARSLAFACTDDGSNKGPLIGVAFSYWDQGGTIHFATSVTTDLAKEAKADTQSNLNSLLAKAVSPSVLYDVGGNPGNSMTVWGVLAPGTPAYEHKMVTMVVWVRDIASTFGL